MCSQNTILRTRLLVGLFLCFGLVISRPVQAVQVPADSIPEENRFTKTVLSNDLNEPMELAIAPDGKVFFTERKGNFYMYDPAEKKTRLIREFPVFWETKYGNGLIGLALDPDFEKNHFVYFYNTPISETPKQHVSRFTMRDDYTLDVESEKILIEIPIDYEISRHTGGSLAFGPDGNLYISTGDNTSPFASNGFTPIDERPDRTLFDDQRSAANPNDLRGKILRIHPEPDGSITIPDGNLFPKNTPGTRPEIYIMGCRNPYRITVDPLTSFLYWGEIGPDGGKDGDRGPRGYDEFNQAKKAGNFGWPYFIGNNIAYRDFDFATEKIGPAFDPENPVNDSPNNTGIKNLPPAQKALIWYPYDESPEFPELGKGGRSAIIGPVYHFDPALKSATKFPAYFDKALFITEWMRNWVFAVRLDKNHDYQGMDQFMPQTGDFRRPIDMTFGPDGSLYALEYGSVYGIDNDDARLVRIDYNAGNRAPVAVISASDTLGTAPLTVRFEGAKSYDLDQDELTYAWKFDGKTVSSTDSKTAFTFKKNGIFPVVLTVTDRVGLSHNDTLMIGVGNTLPQVSIETAGNRTFYFDNQAFNYAVKVKDKEDKVIDPKRIKVQFNFIPQLANQAALIGHQDTDENVDLGKSLLEKSDCKACHQLNKPSVGPAFADVSTKYRADKGALARLANKVITGGGGVWGEIAMNAHPQLSKEEATQIVKYVLALGETQNSLPAQGTKILKEHLEEKKAGVYQLTASYTDAGGAIRPLTGKTSLWLRSAKVEAEQADQVIEATKQRNGLTGLKNGSIIVFQSIDLKNIKNLTYRYALPGKNLTMEVREGSAQGTVIGSVELAATGSKETFAEISSPIQATPGLKKLYFVGVRKEEDAADPVVTLDWITFEQ
ncbi:PQQ-dependent sugar dehydrogenase [Arundinibacter roseus]|uniref:Carbohydrate-binding protein n=1 Tax=Arundinibacter roseus TaxID=2070510 RepID=A0A4R4KRC7_9BACT|nr:PQQ-dependent sugar dehydrogenase [Arundinibacter roseus]TDB68971.1 carbohydrate-binding protein [Arundinibacter roseus]